VALIFRGNRHPLFRAVGSGGQPDFHAVHSRDIGPGASNMKTMISLFVAAVLTLTATISVHAAQGPVIVTPVPASSATTGPWVVGGLGLGVISVMARAAYVGNREKRELTSEEAIGAFLLPFFWTIYPGNPAGQPKHQRRDGSITAGDYNYQQRQFGLFQDADIGKGSTYSGQRLVAPSSNKPPKSGTPTLGGSGGSPKN